MKLFFLRSPIQYFTQAVTMPGIALIGIALLVFARSAHADLMLYPTRIVLEESQRAAQVELINNGQEEATYRISLVNRRMNETGEFLPVDAPLPDEQFADHMVRYSPRQITLAPGAAQTIRLMADRPAGLEEGEYRSHLQFDRLPPPSGESSIETTASSDDKQIGVHLRALIGASIPVIVRHGSPSATVELTGLALREGQSGEPPLLSLDLHRSGNRSVYGDITVTFTPQGGEPQVVGKAGGVAVYTPNKQRRASLALQPRQGTPLQNGVLHVAYSERPEEGGKVLTEANLKLP